MILTTHAGSLPRPAALVELLAQKFKGQPVDESELNQTIEAAVVDVVAKQARVGIDIANDGEQSRESFFTYVQHRMTGFGGRSDAPRFWQDMADFPDFMQVMAARRSGQAVSLGRPDKSP